MPDSWTANQRNTGCLAVLSGILQPLSYLTLAGHRSALGRRLPAAAVRTMCTIRGNATMCSKIYIELKSPAHLGRCCESAWLSCKSQHW